MQVAELVAGREMDALVAERVMECAVESRPRPVLSVFCRCVGETHWQSDFSAGVPHYSTDIAAAWQVVEYMETRQFRFRLHRTAMGWMATFLHLAYPDLGASYAKDAVGDTTPLAICRAALAAIGH